MHRREFFASIEFDFFRVQLKFAFRIRSLWSLKFFALIDQIHSMGASKAALSIFYNNRLEKFT